MSRHWIYPANPKIFLLEEAFHADEVFWPISSKVAVGDTVFIYAGAPYKRILFQTKVVEVGLPAELAVEFGKKFVRVEGKAPKKLYMQLVLEQEFEARNLSPFSFAVLKENGLKGSIMGPQCLENNEELFAYVKKMIGEQSI